MTSLTLTSLAEQLEAQLVGDGSQKVHSVANLQFATPGQISFLSNAKYRQYLATASATAVLVTADDLPFIAPGVAALVVKDPYVAFAKVAQRLDSTPAVANAIHPTAVIDPSAKLAAEVAIGANAVIAAGVSLGKGAQIGAGSYIGQQAKIGSNSKIWPNVTVYHGVEIGDNCIVHSGAIIGADGFGFANESGNWLKIPQVGKVIIGDDCEIGANTTIDRGAIENTQIGNNVIIDNLCQIAHNVSIGDHTALAGCTVVAGSTTIGRYCIIGGAAVINGHIDICDGAHISGMAMVMKPITEKGVYTSGIPATANREWRKNTAKLRQIEQLYQRVKTLESQFKAQLDTTSTDTTTEE